MRIYSILAWVATLATMAQGEFSPKIAVTKNKVAMEQISYFDDSPNILVIRDGKLSLSTDDGKSYQPVPDTKEYTVIGYEFDANVKERAFVLTDSKFQFVTNDKGKSWVKYELSAHDESKSTFSVDSFPVINVNAVNPDLVTIQFWSCPHNTLFGELCESSIYYTTDGFKTNPKKIPIEATVCKFVKTNKLIKSDVDDQTLICSEDKLNSFGHIVESNLRASKDFFAKDNRIIESHKSKTGSIIDIRVVQSFIIVVVQNDKFNKKSKVSLFISKDGKQFAESDFKVGYSYGILSFLDSSPSSLFISAMDAAHNHIASLYASDSSGLKFSLLLDNIDSGSVQKVQTIDGVWLANIGEPRKSPLSDDEKSLFDLLIGGSFNLDIRSKYTFDDGQTWNLLEVENDPDCKLSDECSLHLISPTEESGNSNFVTGPTPGIIMAIGNKGKHLMRNIEKSSTWISRNGGKSWTEVLSEPCQFAFGDLGNVIMAVPYNFGEIDATTDKFFYSLDQGKSWKEEKLEVPVFPNNLITTWDGSSAKFVLTGLVDNTPENQADYDYADVMYAVDFSDAFGGKKCGKNDFDSIYARVNLNDKPVCIYGHKEKFTRRKQDAKCFVNNLFEDVKVYDEQCDCNAADFECSPEFKLSEKGGDVCEPIPEKIKELCLAKSAKEVTVTDKVIIDGNSCKLDKGSLKQFATEHKLKCSDYVSDDDNSAHKTITSSLYKFESFLAQYSYIEEGDFGSENVVVRTGDHKAFISNDGGLTFVRVPISDKIQSFYTGFVPGQVILITDTKKFYFSVDGGNTFVRRHAPAEASRSSIAVSFHKNDSKQFIWYASERCDNPYSADCALTAYITKDAGKNFDVLKEDVTYCDIAGPHFEKQDSDNKNMIFCTVVDKQSSKLKLVSSNNFFQDSKTEYDSIVGHAVSGKFFIVAAIDEEKSALAAKVSVDGKVFADADFPSDLAVGSGQAYTVLGSESNAVFMHVTTSNSDGHEFGTILKSNSNGTFYVTSLEKVNRNRDGYVDYDRIDELEGVIISNTVYADNTPKKLKTQITHNDGGEWSYLAPPGVDSEGKSYDCKDKSLEKCSLNLQGFTERPDYRDTYSSTSAVGLMIGIGNVGETLESPDKLSTFITRDGGITWQEIKKGRYMWEYGDRGTIIVLVKANEPTDTIEYSLDEGATWKNYKFASEPVRVIDLATVPTDTSKKFMVFANKAGSDHTRSYSIDFSGVYSRQCQLDLDNPDKDDFEFWTPSHPKLPDNCLFGHEAKYLRRADGHNDCFIGKAPLETGFKVIRNCTCTRRDFECDYNFFRDTDNTCKLVKGLSPTDRMNEYCKKESAFEYFEPTGYRKIPLSTCEGGKQFDSFNKKACPGKEKEFNKHYGKEVSGGKLVAVILIPLAVFIFATWFVYDRGIRRNGGFARFGQIRLDDDDFEPIENNAVDKVVNRIVRGGILVLAGLIATYKTIKKIDGVLFDKVSSAIFRRSPGRRNYVQVPDIDDEEQLFGNFDENYEDELDEDPTDLTQNFPSESANADIDELNDVEANDDTSADSRLFNIDDDEADEEPEDLGADRK